MRRPALTFLIAALALGGCSQDDDSSGGIGRVDSTALVTVITADDAKVLDPHATSDGGNVKVIHQIYETLVRIDFNNIDKLQPALAESWTVAGDGKVYPTSEGGDVVVLSAEREPKVLARSSLGERFLASPAISGGRLYLRSDNNLFAMESAASTGE